MKNAEAILGAVIYLGVALATGAVLVAGFRAAIRFVRSGRWAKRDRRFEMLQFILIPWAGIVAHDVMADQDSLPRAIEAAATMVFGSWFLASTIHIALMILGLYVFDLDVNGCERRLSAPEARLTMLALGVAVYGVLAP